MPWQTIYKALGSGEGGTLDGLNKALRAVLGFGAPRQGVERAAFTAAVVALSAKLTKADGASIRIEEEAFERLFKFEEAEAENVRWLFRLAARDTAGFESYARDLARTLAERPELMRDVFEALLHIASADGILHDGEDRYLDSVSEIFGLGRAEYRTLRARFVRDPDDPYAALGLARDLDNDTLKARYRALVREHHPDVLAGKGLSREMQDLAQRKLAAINAAWDTIAGERGL